MAPLSFTLATATTSCSTFFSQTPSQQRSLKPHAKQTHRFQVSCNDNHEKPLTTTNPPPQNLILPNTSLHMQNVDRRNLLLGLGGLYTMTGPPSAFAEPIKSPPFESAFVPFCKDAGPGITQEKGTLRPTGCCPPPSQVTEVDYVIPKEEKVRNRKPIHELTPTEMQKFRDAIQIMKSLPDNDPRSFKNQAKVHCAYCNGSYTQNGQQLQVHNSWLFFPFHRWYLYFYERILGDLIKDDTFGLPYWNWDNEEGGMVIPNDVGFGGEVNPLYDPYRDQTHLNKAIVDLDFQGKDRNLGPGGYTTQDINVKTMYRQMVRNAFDTSSFFGGRYVAGNAPISGSDNVVGSIESGCHTAVHRWVGSPKNPNFEDMGNFYSAGFDPLFYMHHSNIDRMWTLWKDIGTGHQEPQHPDWKEASFVFYDENKNLVRVYNKDSVNLDKDKYKYKESEPIWKLSSPRSKPTPKCTTGSGNKIIPGKDKDPNDFPLKIDKVVSLQLERPSKTSRENKKEILFLKGINFNGEKAVKFDVLVNDCGDSTKFSPCDSEFAGSFAAVPHKKGMSMICKSGARFALTELLEEINVVDEKSVRVTIVPREMGKDVSIDDIIIEYLEV